MSGTDVDTQNIIRSVTKLGNKLDKVGRLGKSILSGATAAGICLKGGDKKGAIQAVTHSLVSVGRDLNDIIASGADTLASPLVKLINDAAETEVSIKEVQGAFAEIRQGIDTALSRVGDNDPSFKTAILALNDVLQSTEECTISVLGPLTEKLASEASEYLIKEGGEMAGRAIGGAISKDGGAEIGEDVGKSLGKFIAPAVAPVIAGVVRKGQDLVIKTEYAVADQAAKYGADHADGLLDRMTSSFGASEEIQPRMDTSHDAYVPSIDHDMGSPKPTISEELQDFSPKPNVPEQRDDPDHSSQSRLR